MFVPRVLLSGGREEVDSLRFCWYARRKKGVGGRGTHNTIEGRGGWRVRLSRVCSLGEIDSRLDILFITYYIHTTASILFLRLMSGFLGRRGGGGGGGVGLQVASASEKRRRDKMSL